MIPVAILVILTIILATIASNRIMVPRFERHSRIWFYTVGVLIIAVPWTMWAAYRGYDPEPTVTFWIAAAICGAVTVVGRLVKRELDRRDKDQARSAAEHEVHRS